MYGKIISETVRYIRTKGKESDCGFTRETISEKWPYFFSINGNERFLPIGPWRLIEELEDDDSKYYLSQIPIKTQEQAGNNIIVEINGEKIDKEKAKDGKIEVKTGDQICAKYINDKGDVTEQTFIIPTGEEKFCFDGRERTMKEIDAMILAGILRSSSDKSNF